MNGHIHTTPIFPWRAQEQKLFDFDQLDDVMDGVPPELVELLDSFFQETREEIPQFTGMAEQSEWENLHRRLHTLKGISASFGLAKLSEACRKGEEAAKHQMCREILETRLRHISSALDQTERNLRKVRPDYLPSRQG